MPAGRIFKSKLQNAFEASLGSLAKGVIGGAAVGGSVVHLLRDLSLGKILALGGLVAYVAKIGIDHLLVERATKRECALTYVLLLDEFLT